MHVHAAALERDDAAPLLDQFLERDADGPDLPIEIVEPERVHPITLEPQCHVPVDLIGQ